MRRARMFPLLLLPALLFTGALVYLRGGSSTPTGQPRLVSLDSDRLAPVRRVFNEASAELRLVLLLSPT